MLLRREAITLVLDQLDDQDVVVLANGYISREGCDHQDRERNFYMIGSMGLAASIGLGMALARPATRVVVLDGDGNLLMGLGVLPMVGGWWPHHFLHVVLDNGTYGSTGCQPTLSSCTDFAEMARACGYAAALLVHSGTALVQGLLNWRAQEGPVLIHVRVSPEETKVPPRIPHDPVELANRFSAALHGPARAADPQRGRHS